MYGIIYVTLTMHQICHLRGKRQYYFVCVYFMSLLHLFYSHEHYQTIHLCIVIKCDLWVIQYMLSFCQGSQESVHRDMERAAIMLESIPSGEGRGRSESTALVLDDQEASSSLEDEARENSEFKVVLVPQICVHYHHHSSRAGSSRSTDGGVLEEDEEEDVDQEASTGLLSGTGDCAGASSWEDISINRGSTGSLNSAAGRKNKSGWGKSQSQAVSHKDGENSVETEALIHPSGREGYDDLAQKDIGNLQQSAAKVKGDCKKASADHKKANKDIATHETNRSLGRQGSDPALPSNSDNSSGLHCLEEFEASQRPTSHGKQSDV